MVLEGTGSVAKLVLLGIRWYRVSKGLVCLYILEKRGFGQVFPMPDISHTKEYRATQLVYSIKFKLSHAILTQILDDVVDATAFGIQETGFHQISVVREEWPIIVNHSLKLCLG